MTDTTNWVTMDDLKDTLYWLVTAIGLGIAWGDNVRRGKATEQKVEKVERRLDNNERMCSAAGFLTQTAHDRLQQDCQKLWMSELTHIRETLAEMRVEMKDLRHFRRADEN